MKRRITLVLALMFVLAAVLGMLTACDPEKKSGAEVGEYYCEAADGGENTLELKKDLGFEMKLGGNTKSGKYDLEENALVRRRMPKRR